MRGGALRISFTRWTSFTGAYLFSLSSGWTHHVQFPRKRYNDYSRCFCPALDCFICSNRASRPLSSSSPQADVLCRTESGSHPAFLQLFCLHISLVPISFGSLESVAANLHATGLSSADLYPLRLTVQESLGRNGSLSQSLRWRLQRRDQETVSMAYHHSVVPELANQIPMILSRLESVTLPDKYVKNS